MPGSGRIALSYPPHHRGYSHAPHQSNRNLLHGCSSYSPIGIFGRCPLVPPPLWAGARCRIGRRRYRGGGNHCHPAIRSLGSSGRASSATPSPSARLLWSWTVRVRSTTAGLLQELWATSGILRRLLIRDQSPPRVAWILTAPCRRQASSSVGVWHRSWCKNLPKIATRAAVRRGPSQEPDKQRLRVIKGRRAARATAARDRNCNILTPTGLVHSR
jgi:hypothetical protein